MPASFGAEQRELEGHGGVGRVGCGGGRWGGGVRPSNSQFDGLELIWVFASAEMNFSCWSPSREGRKPTKCCSGSVFSGGVGTFFFFFVGGENLLQVQSEEEIHCSQRRPSPTLFPSTVDGVAVRASIAPL